MRHLPLNEIASRVARQVACARCSDRPQGSEALGPEVARPCEATCPLFVHLPKLVTLAATVSDGPDDWERGLKDAVCATCRLRPSAGEFCPDYAARTCPLSRYSGDVIGALQHVVPTRPA